ncbi:Restless-like transposase [Fusarium oxysporum f. sp. albedinis]|nr:Restless-like transposase [Fusarium oxysporum f. sp. albedinis]
MPSGGQDSLGERPRQLIVAEVELEQVWGELGDPSSEAVAVGVEDCGIPQLVKEAEEGQVLAINPGTCRCRCRSSSW